MNLSCAVIGDLLPLYAEDLTSEDSAALVREHLEACPDCREKLENLRQSTPSAEGGSAPIKNLKKELRRRRRRVAAIAALTVFVLLFAVLARATGERPLAYSPELVRVEGLKDYGPDTAGTSSGAEYSPPGWETSSPGKALVLHRSDEIRGVAMEHVLDPDTGELTVCLQYWSSPVGLVVSGGGLTAVSFEKGGAEDVFYPVPDRVIYGFGAEQTLLWGEPMSGGVQVLPRLALAYYALIAAGLTVLLGLAWLAFRKKKAAGPLGRLCLAPASYLLGHLFIKGLTTTGMFLGRDLWMICAEALAIYVLITLTVSVRRDGQI